MCSIMTCYESSVSPEAFRTGFERTKSRGPDDSRIVERDGIYVQTYRIAPAPEPFVPMHGATLEDRIFAVESGLAEIAQMLANGRE